MVSRLWHPQYMAQGPKTMEMHTMEANVGGGEWQGSQTGVRSPEDHPD